MPTDTTLDTSKMSAADKIKAANSLYSTANTLAKSPDYQKSLGGYYAADTAAFDYQTNQMGTTEGSGQDLNWLVGDAPNPGQTYRDLAGQVTDSFKQANDLITSAVKDDPSLIKSLSPQTQLQYSFSRWKSGDISRNDYADTAHQIMADYKIPEYNYDASGNRTQFNVFGDQVAQGGLNPNPLVPTTLVGAYNIQNNPQDSYDIFQKIATNPIANIVATMIPGGSAVLAGIRIGQHGDVTPGDVIGMLNGGAQLYSYNAASTAALEAGKSAAQAQAAGIKGTVGIAELATDAGKDVFTSMFPDASKAVGDFTQSIKDLGASAVSSVKDVLGVSSPMSTEASANLVAQIPRFPSPTDAISAPDTSYRDYLAGLQPSGVEQIIVPGSRSIVDTVLNAAAGVPAAVSSAPDATGPNTSPGTVTYGTETPTWKASNSAILNFLASNPSQAAIDAAKAQYNVSDADIAKAKETEVRTITGSNTGVGASDILAALLTAVTPIGGTGVTPTTPPPMDVLTTYGSTAGPVTKIDLPSVDAVVPLLTQTSVDTTKAPPTDNTKIKMPSGGGPPPAVDTPQTPASLAMPKPTEIDPYTWESIFRNKEQAKKYISPFDRGNEVAYDDTSQMLRDMLRS